MLLCEKDISRLVKRGFAEPFFVRIDREGYAQLRNKDGYCVFYDPKNKRCNIYSDRPAGCRVYPVILDEEKGIILDDLCHVRDSVGNAERGLKGKRVIKLLERIDFEAEERRSRS